MTLPPLMVSKLKRLIPLLGSPHDGEALAARNMIVRELASGKCDLHDLAGSLPCDIAPPPEKLLRRDGPLHSFGDLARAARDLDRGRLSLTERAFIVDMVAKGFSFWPSARQAQWLDDILDRLQRRAAA